jgi:DNA topoisomerase-1
MNKTDKILVIVESPHKAKVITKILKDAGYTNTRVVASVGHILKLADGNRKAFNSGIYPEDSFRMNLKIAEDKYKVVEEIKTHVKWADKIFIAADGDRSGEFISWSLLEYINIPKSKTARMIMHEITPKAVLHALENPVPFDNALVDAEKARQCTDKLIGYSLSPEVKKHIGAKSVGRCQSVGLMLVADRENEILDFVPEKYFNLYLNFTKNGKYFKAKYLGYKNEKYDKIKNASEIKTIKYNCQHGDYVIENVSQAKRNESPKPPFCTATFQQEASSRLGLKVKDAMSIAQKLYEAGHISYMRTDDTDMSPEFLEELKAFVEASYDKACYKGLRAKKATGAITQNGHECLRITDPTLTPEIFAQNETNNLAVKVYTLVWQRTIAAVMPNAVYSETTNTINNNDHKFVLTEKILTDPGFRTIYSYRDDADEILTEAFKVDEVLENTKLEEVARETMPPPRYTEASLVKELQKLDIGRPSTFATIVETILSPTRGYTNLEEKQIVPTSRGLQLAAYCKRAFPKLINLNYTKAMEEQLDKIASGTLDWLDYMTSFYKDLSETIETNHETGLADDVEEKLCPQCGKKLVARRSRFGKLFFGCSSFPHCRYTESIM